MQMFFLSLAVYSVIALAVEAAFTSLDTLVRSIRSGRQVNWSLPGETSLGAIPVYGLSAALSYNLIGAVYPDFYAWPWPCRGLAYMIVIFAWEFFWGWLSERTLGKCPWQYRESKYRILRYNNPYYALFWFGFGFLLEKIHQYLVPHLALLFLA